ncbi:CPBP family intramembrane glutamic endopeptidase [Corynebacterium mendelii]|uniref:CPBP family intramembrane metalloprotease n=1 Tax=Corynebacterium mendelii TaxID=2765362 RepID=A0A939E1A3_9CORY|nr:CPBP family intramembrane glutamic endopeptidase [Corynebacterium mendelii]MBN9645129.1 CPBP family intramembrane metalloprotease [Corynebacterium mendelii]
MTEKVLPAQPRSAAQRKRIALLAFAAYFAIMGMAMFVIKHVAGSSYTSNDMTATLFWFEVPMTCLAVFVWLRFFRGSLTRLRSTPRSRWLVVAAALLGANALWMLWQFFTTAAFDGRSQKLLLFMLATTFLVGVSEEIIFRGIMLPAYLETAGRIRAIIISSAFFSVFHVVNILGGLPVESVLVQMTTVFVGGITYAVIALELGAIWPLMLYHFVWDFTLLTGFYTNADLGAAPSVGTALEMIAGPVMLVVLLVHSRKNTHR